MSRHLIGLGRRVYAPQSVSLAVVCLIFLLACEPADFTEFEGVNFLEMYAFDSPSWTTDQSAPYLLFEEVSATIAAEVGLPAGLVTGDPGTAVYRLEVLNLIPNGDFEDDALIATTPTGWTDGGSSTATVTASGSLSGDNELAVSVADGGWVAFDLEDTAGGAIDGIVADSFYSLRFDFDPAAVANYQFQYDDTTDATLPSVPRWTSFAADATHDYAFPFDFDDVTSGFSASSVQNHFAVVENAQSLEIDNLRLVREDIPLSIRLGLPYSDSGRPDLISGTYTFSFYVHEDPTVGRLTPAENLNRFHARAVSYGVDAGIDVDSDGEDSAAGETIDFSEWYRARTEVFLQIADPTDPGDTAIEVHIAASDIVNVDMIDAGSILIAAPALSYSPD